MDPRKLLIKLAAETEGFSLSNFLQNPAVRYGALGAAGGAGLMGLGEALRAKRPSEDRNVLGRALMGALIGGASGSAVGLGTNMMGLTGQKEERRGPTTAARVVGSGLAGGVGAGGLFSASMLAERQHNLRQLLEPDTIHHHLTAGKGAPFSSNQLRDFFTRYRAAGRDPQGILSFLRGVRPEAAGRSHAAAQEVLRRVGPFGGGFGAPSRLASALRNPYLLGGSAALLGLGHYAMRPREQA